MEKVRYMISDAANIVNVESHVLRYWEDELELEVPRNELGHRYYTKENIQEFQRIKELKEQGYQLKAIRMIVHNLPLDAQAEVGAVNMEKRQDLHQIPHLPEETLAKEMQPACAPFSENTSLPVSKEQESILENTDKMAQFTELMTRIVGSAIVANNKQLSRSISEDVGQQVVKEMNYLMRAQEEADEERFQKLDEAIRGNLKRKENRKKWNKKKPEHL